MTDKTQPNTAIMGRIPDYTALQRTPMDDNFADTEVIEGLDVGDTESFDPIRDTTVQAPVPASVSKPPRRQQPLPEGRPAPGAPRASRGHRKTRKRSAGGWLLFQITDCWKIFREEFTDPRKLARFFGVVLPIGLAVAFTTNQVFGPETGPLSNLRLPVEQLRPLDEPTYSPEPVRSAPVRRPIIPATNRSTPTFRTPKPQRRPVIPPVSKTPVPTKPGTPSPSEEPTKVSPPVESPTETPDPPKIDPPKTPSPVQNGETPKTTPPVQQTQTVAPEPSEAAPEPSGEASP